MMTVEEIQKAIKCEDIVYMVDSSDIIEVKVYAIKLLKIDLLKNNYCIYHYELEDMCIKQSDIASIDQNDIVYGRNTDLVLFKRQIEAIEYMLDKVKDTANTKINGINKAIINVNKVAYKYGMSLAQIPYRTVIKGD